MSISRSFVWVDDSVEHTDHDHDRAIALAAKWSSLMTRCEWEERQAVQREEQALEIELVEDKLADIGARMMRPYEHWNEDEHWKEYMETRYDNDEY